MEQLAGIIATGLFTVLSALLASRMTQKAASTAQAMQVEAEAERLRQELAHRDRNDLFAAYVRWLRAFDVLDRETLGVAGDLPRYFGKADGREVLKRTFEVVKQASIDFEAATYDVLLRERDALNRQTVEMVGKTTTAGVDPESLRRLEDEQARLNESVKAIAAYVQKQQAARQLVKTLVDRIAQMNGATLALATPPIPQGIAPSSPSAEHERSGSS